MQEEFLKPSQIAPLMGVTKSRIYQLIAAGVIPVTRVGGALRIPRAAWKTWLEAQTREALAAVGEARSRVGKAGR